MFHLVQLWGQGDLQFDNYSTADGLSQSSALTMASDKTGFLWIGTQDGLNRFDGYDFAVFRHRAYDTTSISANHINHLLNDSKDRLWIATMGGGLCLLDTDRNTFVRINHNPSDSSSLWSDDVHRIYEDVLGNLWIATRSGLNQIDGVSLRCRRIDRESTDERSNWINDLTLGPEGRLWLATNRGLYWCDTSSSEIERVDISEDSCIYRSELIVGRLHLDSDKRLWLGTSAGILLLKDVRSPCRRIISDENDTLEFGDTWITEFH